MSSLNNYRNNITRKNSELIQLQQQKANERHKIGALASKINSASQALSRIRSQNTAQSKLREIERYEKEKTSHEKKIADLESKIAKKQSELFAEEKKLQKEEDSLNKKRVAETERLNRNHITQLDSLGEILQKHDTLHRRTISEIEQLKKLPEDIVVLFLAANPIDQQQLRLDEEARSIAEMIRKSKHRDSVKFETRWAIRPLDVLQAINEFNPTIVHFSGHGTDADEIVFQNNDGTAKTTSKEAIVQTMMASSNSIRLVFFNTCYSHNQAQSVTNHVEAAIGMNTSIGDEAARIFASQFYSSIGFGLSISKAFNQAKALIMLEGIPEENTPELFVQDGLNGEEIIIVRPD